MGEGGLDSQATQVHAKRGEGHAAIRMIPRDGNGGHALLPPVVVDKTFAEWKLGGVPDQMSSKTAQ